MPLLYRRVLLPLSLLTLLACPTHASDVTWVGAIEGQWLSIRDSDSWLEGGFGVLAEGEDGQPSDSLRGSIATSIEWDIGDRFATHLHLLGSSAQGRRDASAGIVEAFLQLDLLDLEERSGAPSHHLRLRLGTAFLPTTFENVAPLWRSPYAVSSSALTNWIGEEFRPSGLQVEYRNQHRHGWSSRFGTALFGGTDSAGALIAWRGWGPGDRLTLWDEVVPLPALPSLGEDGLFAPQRSDGTKPFGRDLDGRLGWAAWAGATAPGGSSAQATWVDTRGDRDLHHGEYAWDSQFAIVGGEVPIGRSGLLAAEWMWGSTAMQPGPQPRVDIDFSTWYLLANREVGRWQTTLRYEAFENTDRAHYPGTEPADQDGHAWTLAAGVQLGHLNLRLEWLDVDSERPSWNQPGDTIATGGRQATLELTLDW